jgi:hypothetical protein
VKFRRIATLSASVVASIALSMTLAGPAQAARWHWSGPMSADTCVEKVLANASIGITATCKWTPYGYYLGVYV